ncbi:MAG: division/cell wall cluster transcriptional repressor MraZ [Cycloclasticus sp. symbiont of Poecilosclerida sp. M]|nr:MAG: division/cell wall cluster transcriptional repressor MraZ [Cycloclasticus sp. symbiont of Poecilosclerida sp. M]
MFRGVNNVTLDAKGRLSIPTRYRVQLLDTCNGQMVMTVDREHSLLLYPLATWEDIERKLIKLPSLDKQARRLQRLLIGHATECELDSQGRVLVSPPLREFAQLDKKVVMIGQGNKFEIWDNQTWAVKRDQWFDEENAAEGDLSPELGALSL